MWASTDINYRDTPRHEMLREQMSDLKRTIEKLEADKLSQRSRIKELSEEIASLQKKLVESSHFGSDGEDSPDALSEIDRQQELYNNISMKNKHIKRLLRDIEDLEKRNSFQIDTINSLQVSLSDATENLTALTNQYEEAKALIGSQKATIDAFNEKVCKLEKELAGMVEKKRKCEDDLEDFAEQLEVRTVRWKAVLGEKQAELEEVQTKYAELLEQFPGYDVEAERNEFKRMVSQLEEKNELILVLEEKITMLSQEILTSTELMNRISQEKENTRNEPSKISKCCEESRTLLERANKRCEEMQEILTNVEEDNLLKSRQVTEAVDALKRYESGEDGLANALKRINRLHEKVNVRDKQIRELVKDINEANEVVMENTVLRKRLGISEDEIVPIHSILSKQRKIEKVNERLALKLRASEEMRLQLKLEKNDLKRKLSQMSHSLSSQRISDEQDGEQPEQQAVEAVEELGQVSDDLEDSKISHIKFCEKCMTQYNVHDSKKHCKACIYRRSFNYCDGCIQKLKVNFGLDEVNTKQNSENIKQLEEKYVAVVEENENLRIGMHEILEKLRDYDAMSNHLTIDTSTLERLLHALDARSVSGWYHPAMRLQNELLATREREILLKERLNLRSKQSTFSVTSRDDSGNVCDDEDNTADMNRLITEQQSDFSEQVLLKSVEIDRLNELITTLKEEKTQWIKSNDEFSVTKKSYDELLRFTRAAENEKDKLMAETLDRLKQIESNICTFQRKVDFLKAENDNLHNTLRTIQADHLNVLHELKSELARKNTSLKSLELDLSIAKRNGTDAERDSIEKMEMEIDRMKRETADLYSSFLKNIQEVDKQNLLDFEYAQLSNFGLIESNLTMEFIPKNEFRRLENQLKAAEEELKRQIIKNANMDELLKASHEQIQSQQLLISKQSEEEIALRHLVADLQSASNEKYLLARTQKTLDEAREQEELLKLDNIKLKQSLMAAAEESDGLKEQLVQQEIEFTERQKDNVLKIEFLTQTVKKLHENYNSCTPTYAVTDFVKQYVKLMELKKSISKEVIETLNQSRAVEFERWFTMKMNDGTESKQIQDKINLIQYKSQTEYLTRQLMLAQEQVEQLQEENSKIKLKAVENTRHWDTIELIFNGEGKTPRPNGEQFDKEIQASIEISHKCINTIPIIDDSLAEVPRKGSPPATPVKETRESGQMTDDVDGFQGTTMMQKSHESQLKQAMMLASTRSALLLETESRLTECHGRIKMLEKMLENKDVQLKKEKASRAGTSSNDKLEDGILSSTIGSLQNLLLEKDSTLSRYLELLRSERQEHSKAYDENMVQIRSLKKAVDELEQKFYDKQREVDSLNTQIKNLMQYKAAHEANAQRENETNEMQVDKPGFVYTDKIIENIYEMDQKKEDEIEALKIQIKMLENKVHDAHEETRKLQAHLKEMTAKEKRTEKTIREKDTEIVTLNERLSKEHDDLKEFSDSIASAQEIEQLREMLEEKDRHIQDLTETLSQFHDDQQKFMNDTSLHSAEQISQLSADLNRSEASNRVLKTQIDALKRQIMSIQQREKQSRDLVKTLKNQLIRRPVIAMKSERTTTPKEDQLSRKLQQLETELLDTKDDLRKQISINENRRAKNAAELDLWNKQKRWQQTADKLKIQLKEREMELEKLKVHFSTAKTTIVRLERDKAILEGRGTRGGSAPAASSGGRFGHTESPDSCATESTGSDETSMQLDAFARNSKEIIESLKNRIESQQRRIIAMELERKGSNTMTHELERMHEKLSNLEAQNIRLEAKVIQLHLDNDMLRQSDESERLRSQVKHFEGYVNVLKEELSKATAGCPETINFDSLCPRCTRTRTGVGSGAVSNSELVDYNSKLEQTVLALRRVVEKLKVENKQLMEGKLLTPRSSKDGGKTGVTDVTKENFDRLKKEHEKLQQSYSEALNRVAALQLEIELLSSASCPRCNVQNSRRGSTDEAEQSEEQFKGDELKEQLENKSQLLEKAKILLTRAAAKERYLKEQISLLRRKCSDLQNVPVIDEISE
ncbi:centrosomal protein cep290 isoform X2 [Toxorhynchites rutilus septentrionalis]|uniref:centrosomal protein cep290 isoform X2 n=1 Tax=Toxorhynchites rutilus septentrionalis TaxID=329112 RepID=UPI002479011F|nr:centrosomal protein cep290 isoform X2 [Toxorhynchites rutilus septentrionalis]